LSACCCLLLSCPCCCCCCSAPAKSQPSAVQLEEEALARIQAAVAERYAAAIAGPDVQVGAGVRVWSLAARAAQQGCVCITLFGYLQLCC
jgi:hypothetical protein